MTKSRTRLCDPNETASPTTPALASSGPMLKPSWSSTRSTVTTTSTARPTFRNSLAAVFAALLARRLQLGPSVVAPPLDPLRDEADQQPQHERADDHPYDVDGDVEQVVEAAQPPLAHGVRARGALQQQARGSASGQARRPALARSTELAQRVAR